MRTDDQPVAVDGRGLAIGVVVSRFNSQLTFALRDAALETLAESGVTDVTVVEVAGSLELPLLAAELAIGRDAVIALGVVIEGETDHYEHVATQSMAGLMRVSLDTGTPIANGLLTVRQAAHAIDRSKPGRRNKGGEAAVAALMAAQAVRSLR